MDEGGQVEQYRKPRIGITLGDQAGIGPEIVLKLLERSRIYETCIPILIGNFELLMRTAAMLGTEYLIRTKTPEEAVKTDWDRQVFQGITLVQIDGDYEHVVTGMVNTAAGWISYHSIAEGYRLLEKGVIDGLILSPVTKEAISKCGCGYHSEYEILASLAGVPEVQTIVKGGGILRASVAGHIPFRDILKTVTVERIAQTGRQLCGMMKKYSDGSGHIFVSALNTCDGGVLGEEEQGLILPAIRILQSEGIPAVGPFPPDQVFEEAKEAGNAGILYMYHDQGNIPMKSQMFQSTTCIYTNVPYPILSTGHGSALDIVELGIANPTNILYVLSVMTDYLNRAGLSERKDAVPEERPKLLNLA